MDHSVVHIVMAFYTFHSLDYARKYQLLSFILPVSDARSPQTLRWKATVCIRHIPYTSRGVFKSALSLVVNRLVKYGGNKKPCALELHGRNVL